MGGRGDVGVVALAYGHDVVILQDSTVFANIDTSEYIADLWRNPNKIAKENLEKFESVRTVYTALWGALLRGGCHVMICADPQ